MTYLVRGKVNRKSMEDAVGLSKEKSVRCPAMLEKSAKMTVHIEYLDGPAS